MRKIRLSKRFNAAMIALESTSRGLSTRERLLIQIHASHMNGCSYCIEMHEKEAAKKGIDPTPQSDREKLILELTEMGTRLGENFEEESIEQACEQLGESTVANVITTIVSINAWNRIGLLTGK